MEEHLTPPQSIATNKNGGIYSRGRAYGTNKKSDVLTAYYESILTHKPHITVLHPQRINAKIQWFDQKQDAIGNKRKIKIYFVDY